MNYGDIFDLSAKLQQLDKINIQLSDKNIWKNPKYAQNLGKNKKLLENVIFTLLSIEENLDTAWNLFLLAKTEKDTNTLTAIESDTQQLKNLIENMEFRRMFNKPADINNCFINIKAGAGGTEAQDWSSILLRQYTKYCERKGFQAEILEQSSGEIAGIKTATIKVQGEYAYGCLRTESGVHRLVRKSPFNSANERHTSFSSLFVYPEVDNSIDIEIHATDVRIDTYRASGAGGQHINKTDSAVRLTHIPSGIVVQCQNDRSQHRNRSEAWDMLKARLYELELRKRINEQKKLENLKTDVAWGYQIRSYILDQSRIKDLRTNYETGDTKSVLDGNLDQFIEAALKQGL